MNKWTELRTAYLVAKHGTVSAAAELLGVHRATINRHIDALERSMDSKLFQRHARGYTPTEAGRDLLETAERAEQMFSDFYGRASGRKAKLSGELIVTALSGTAPLIMPTLAAFRAKHPEVQLTLSTSAQLARLEYGEAHLAVRAGSKPQEPDYVVLPFTRVRFGLYAHSLYIAKHGKPTGLDDLSGHFFVGSLAASIRTPYAPWMREHIDPKAIVLNTNDPRSVLQGVLAGLGLGFIAQHDAADNSDLIPVADALEAWSAPLWLVTHIDLHHTSKVQALLKLFKSAPHFA